MLKNKIVKLIPLEEVHLRHLMSWRNSDDAYANFFEFKPLTLLDQGKWFRRYLAREDQMFIITDVQDASVVGMIGLSDISFRNRRAELHSFYVDPAYRGKCYGSGALDELILYASRHLNLRKLYCRIFASNDKARRFYEHMSFAEEGKLLEYVYKDGVYNDILIMGRCI